MMYDTIIKNYKLKPIEELYQEYLAGVQTNEGIILYHYTDYEGLKGILSKKRFWLTNYRDLNDPKEVIYSLDLIRKTISQQNLKNQVLDNFLREFEKLVSFYTIGIFEELPVHV